MGARPLAVASALFMAGAWAGVTCSRQTGVALGAAALSGAMLAASLAWSERQEAARGGPNPLERPPRGARATAAVLLLLAASAGLLRGALAPRATADARLETWLRDPQSARGGREAILLEGHIEETAFSEEGARLVLRIDRREPRPGGPLEDAPPGLRALLSGPRSLHRGDSIRALARLHLPEPQRNPGGRDVRAELDRRGIALSGALDESGIVLLSRGPQLLARLDRARDSFARRCAEVCGTPARAALVAALGVGDRAGLDVESSEELTDSGLVHLLSSAGLHLAVVALLARSGLSALLLQLAWTRRRRASALAALLSFPVIAVEVLLLGAPWPAVRAGVAAALALAAPLLSRRFDALTGLLVGLALCGLWDPASLAGMPLLLSFSGVLGLIALAPRLRELVPLRRPPPGATLRVHPIWVAREELLRLLCASAAAALCTAPWMATAFHRVSLVSALANALGLWPGLAALPIASAAVPLDVLGRALDLPLALPFFWAADGLAGLLLHAAHFFAQLPAAALELPAPGPLTAALWTLSLLLLAGWPAPLGASAHPLRARPRVLALRAAVPLGLLLALSMARVGIARFQAHLEAIFLSVGQGDAAIVRFPDGSAMLVDAGGDLRGLPAPHGAGHLDPGARDVLPALAELGISRLDLVVLSHPHPDHAGGLFAVLRAMPVDELWLTGEPGPGDIGGKLERDARARGIAVRTPAPGEVWERGGARVEVLSPDPRWSPERSTNDNSIVLRVVHQQVALLLAGDAEALEESQLAQGPRELHAQLLKAGHHGSRTSSTDAFLRAVSPDWVVFSMGEGNPFGFPHAEVVERATSLGAQTLQTAAGAVLADSDGQRLRVRSFAPP